MAVVDTPWARLLPLAGIGGTTVLLALLGFLLAAVVSSAWRRDTSTRTWTVLLLAVVFALSLLPTRIAKPVEASRDLTVAIVQGGVPGDGTGFVGNHRQATRNQQVATQRLASGVQAGEQPAPDVVIWPENSELHSRRCLHRHTGAGRDRDLREGDRCPRARRGHGGPSGSTKGPQPGDRLGSRDRTGGAVHQASSGAFRGVNPFRTVIEDSSTRFFQILGT